VTQKTEDNWVKNPETDKYEHIEFLAYEYKDEQGTHSGQQLVQTQTRLSKPHKPYVVYNARGANRDESFYQLGNWRETDPQFMSGRHMMYPTTTPTQPLEIAAVPQTEEIAATPHIEMEEIAATVNTPAPPTENRTTNGNRALSGVHPRYSMGDRQVRTLSGQIYELRNRQRRRSSIHYPLSQVALCLSYFNGPKVDAWARQHRLWLSSATSKMASL